MLGRYFTKETDTTLEASNWSVLKDAEDDALPETTDEPMPSTSKQIADETQPSTSTSYPVERKYCFCRGVDDGTPMTACTSNYCSLRWFHMRYVGLTDIPNYNWRFTECESSSDSC